MLSGIGPKKHLNELNIPVHVNLPTGKNLQNHFAVHLGPFLIDKPLSIVSERDINEESVNAFLKNGTGPLSLGFDLTGHTLWTSTRALTSGEGDRPDIHVFFSPKGVSQNAADENARRFNIRSEIMKEFYDPVSGRDAFFFFISLGRPESRGEVKLRTSNYMDESLINPRAFEDPKQTDLQTMVEGIQRSVYLAENAPSFRKIGAKLSPIPFPSCKDLVFRSQQYWECFAKEFTIHLHHYAGTTPMGPENSLDAVVDSQLRVLGTKSLRIVDAGIMPYVVTTNTYATTMMIAEKAASMIIKSNS